MYKHKVDYRYNTPEGNISGIKTLEFELEKELYHDGPGEWRNICANIISSKTGINVHDIRTNDSTMTLKCLGKVKTATSTPSSNSSNSDNRDYHAEKKAQVKAEREEREAQKEWEAKQKEKKKQKELEEDRAFAEKKAREKAERKRKAEALRSEGKNFQAFMVEFQDGIIAVGSILGMLILGGVIMIYSTNQTEEAKKINSQLEQIEDSVRIYINEGNYDRALVLTNQLVHPLNEVYEGKGTMWESEYYDQYWNKKREEYKNIILNKGTLDTQDSGGENAKKNNSEETPSADENSNTDIPQESEQAMPSVESEEQLDPEYQ